jgi:SAM-dependent methyltransferase
VAEQGTVSRKAVENVARWRAQAPAWRQWRPQLTAWWKPITEAMIARADLRPGLAVLDLASGTGEPSITLAPLVLPGGTIIATDLLPEMIAMTATQARLQRHANLHCLAADAGFLPFADASFDRVTCRFGVMFFPDALQALREVSRVLRPGGRVVFTAWGPVEAQTYATSTIGVVQRRLGIPASPPSIFNAPGALANTLREAGLAAVQETLALILPFPGRPADFLAWYRGAVTPFDQELGRLPSKSQAAVLDEVLATVGRYDDGQQLNFSAPVVVAVATR